MKNRPTDRETQTEISEIFSSIQGEGPYLGVPQIFVRFGRCNMHCHYCDELEKMKEERFTIYTLDGVLGEIDAFEKKKGAHHSVSLTGGEPLFYSKFLRNLLPKLKEKGITTYLETNGTLPRELETVMKWIDVVAMDMKPTTSTGDRDFTIEHEAFLRIAIQKDVFVKVVVTPETTWDEVSRCIAIVKGVNPRIPFIFQPVSELVGINQQALDLIERDFIAPAKQELLDVRVIPQMHKIWGVR
ncbi:MAG TPA: 7-carboxy-7-deazaguanine synthase QueE [Candidatus Eisenbacteria bacterium]|nr:7-carboxy-7-deazaguanine synthase QueE [Candidatus Eisenbacteria bacterium]